MAKTVKSKHNKRQEKREPRQKEIIFDGKLISKSEYFSRVKNRPTRLVKRVIGELKKEEDELKREQLEKEIEEDRLARAKELENKRYEGCVVRFSHIPPGFIEHDIRKYFEQFGDVADCVLARSAKTGKPMSFAFIKFENAEVAKIAAQTMNNYVAFKRLMKASVVHSREAEKYWKTKLYGPVNCPGYASRTKNAVVVNRVRSSEKEENLRKKHLSKLKKRMKELKRLGINYIYKPYIDKTLDEKRKERREQKKIGKKKAEESQGKKVEKIMKKCKHQKTMTRSMTREEAVKKRIEEKIKRIANRRRKERKGKKGRQTEEENDKKGNRWKKSLVAKKWSEKLLKPIKTKEHDLPEQLDGTFNSIPVETDKLVMEIDESDSEIEFKTPPNVVKRKLQRRSCAEKLNNSSL